MVSTKLIKLFPASVAFTSFALISSCAAEEQTLSDISLPPGFVIDVYADVPNARSLALGDNGTVFVANRREDSVYAIVAGDAGSVEVIEVASGLSTPNGIAFFAGDLYVAEIDQVMRYSDVESRLRNMPDAELLRIELPSEKHHGWRYIGFGPDGKLYISIGAPCNVCEREGYGQIIRMNPDGSNREVVATGVRNSVGFTWHPDNEELWFTDNGRDMLGDDLPADELNHASRDGLDFGFPYCHAGEIIDPEFGKGRDCADYTPPAQKLGPHVASLGVKFYTGTEFPEEYQGQIFIAEHGSWNRSEKIGYRVSLIRLQDGKPIAYEVFADGWLQGNTVNGRPVDLLILDDGSMLLSDDHAGKVYRIRYEGSG
ncbi:MAG: PQQ-dependent sugar dehydrogenase [Woeseiaceae bacterium]